MNSKIYTGTLMHHRLEPVDHFFVYPAYFYRFDLDELPALSQKIPFFSYNAFNIASIYDSDYMERGSGTIKEKLVGYLKSKGFDKPVSRIELITSARFLGHAFNPVSFYYCYDDSDALQCIVAQVNNTFDESHLYLLSNDQLTAQGQPLRFQADKEFHVSPFFDRSGHYDFKFNDTSDNADIQVNLFRNGKPALLSRLQGTSQPLTTSSLIKTSLRFPLSVFLTVPRIHWHALKLYFFKKLPFFSKPSPVSKNTIRKSRPKLKQRFAMFIVDKFLSKLKRGKLNVTFPDQTVKTYNGPESGTEASIEIDNYNFYTRLLTDAGIGLGEGFMAGDWKSQSVTDFLKLLIENKPHVPKKTSNLETVGHVKNRKIHKHRKNTVKKSKSNIQDHYDLGNDFFELFLDQSMMYSSAVYFTEEESLDSAQKNKLRKMIDKADIQPTDHILEIGFGWGGFAIEAVQRTGCKVTGITLSEEQLKFAEERVEALRLSDKINFQLCDYRNLKGQFDKIVSIEMLEAVGHEYLGTFFTCCDSLLKPNGVAVIQVITIPHERYDSYRKGVDWIQKHIFPGGHLPSLEILKAASSQDSGLRLEAVENIGPHYAKTLAEWRRRFMRNYDKITALGFDESKMKAWEYYFSYCEAGFAKEYIDDLQLVFRKDS